MPPEAQNLIVYGTDDEGSQGEWDQYAAYSQLSARESHYSAPNRKRAAEGVRPLDRGEVASPGGGAKRPRAEGADAGDEAEKKEDAPPPKACPCGGGMCSVFTSSTERNPGRKFYRCPLGKVRPRWRI